MLAVALVMALGTLRAAEGASSGFVIAPAFQQASIKTDQPRMQYALQLTNRNTRDQNFRLSVADFGSLGEQGGVAFLGQPTSELEHEYGLASWMSLEKDAVFVPAGGTAQILATVENRASLAPGGHYAAVLATAIDEAGQPVKDQVGVKQVLSSLVLVIKEGGGVEDLRLLSQTGDGNGLRLPTVLEQRFQNSGNVHLVPRGVSEVRDPIGRVVVRGALNEASAAILPETFRRYKTPLQVITAAWMPGWYEVKTTYRYDGTEQTKTLVTRAWYAGAALVWGMLALTLLGAAAGLWWWLRRRDFRRKEAIVGKAVI